MRQHRQTGMGTCRTEVEELHNETGYRCWINALPAYGRSISQQSPIWSAGQEVYRACSSSLRMSLPALVLMNQYSRKALEVEVRARWHPVAGVAGDQPK